MTPLPDSFDWLDGRILFLGDSVTQEGTYVSLIEYTLQRTYPERTIDVIGLGLSSETASGLSEPVHITLHAFARPCVHERLGAALAKSRPRTVVACYGMNDGIYHPPSPSRLEAFQDGIRRLIVTCTDAGARVLLLTPPPFDPVPIRKRLASEDATDYSYVNPYARYDRVLEDYSRWIMALTMPGMRAVDLNTPLTTYLRQQRVRHPDFCFSRDGIHPSKAGHLLMARTILQAMGAPAMSSADLEEDLMAIQADPLFVLVDQRRRARSEGWLPFVGYTAGVRVNADAIAPTETEVASLQEKINHLRRR